MIHGLWSDANAFEDMEQSLAASNYEPFQLFRLDYRGTNDSSFSVNFPLVAAASTPPSSGSAMPISQPGRSTWSRTAWAGFSVGSTSRTPGYEHEVRRLITSNTPHAGSQMANLLLDRASTPGRSLQHALAGDG